MAGGCPVDRLEAMMLRDSVLIYAHPDTPNCRDLYFSWDIAKKTWSDVQVGEPLPGTQKADDPH